MTPCPAVSGVGPDTKKVNDFKDIRVSGLSVSGLKPDTKKTNEIKGVCVGGRGKMSHDRPCPTRVRPETGHGVSVSGVRVSGRTRIGRTRLNPLKSKKITCPVSGRVRLRPGHGKRQL